MKRINLVVEEGLKDKWQKFVDSNEEISTISKLIRRGVDNYIENLGCLDEGNKLTKNAHQIKEHLSYIKGYTQMLMDDLQKEEKLDVVSSHSKLHQIYQNTINIENIINLIQNPEKKEREIIDVLIVDDNPDAITLIANILEKKGLSYRSAPSGNSALGMLRMYIPKLILLDILLPDGDGYDICKKIKTNNDLKDIPVYYITAVPETEVAERLKDTGAEDYIQKENIFKGLNQLLENF